jgi:REP element-mobilizing transposase RayT
MTVKRAIHQSWGIYFITFTCTGWVPLFERTQSYDTVYKWFNVLKSSGHHVLGYVIMPNHVHVLVAFCQNEKGVNKIVSNGKRFMAYEIVKRLTQNSDTDLLKQLAVYSQLCLRPKSISTIKELPGGTQLLSMPHQLPYCSFS